jgi:hypothetical protein
MLIVLIVFVIMLHHQLHSEPKLQREEHTFNHTNTLKPRATEYLPVSLLRLAE